MTNDPLPRPTETPWSPGYTAAHDKWKDVYVKAYARRLRRKTLPLKPGHFDHVNRYTNHYHGFECTDIGHSFAPGHNFIVTDRPKFMYLTMSQ